MMQPFAHHVLEREHRLSALHVRRVALRLLFVAGSAAALACSDKPATPARAAPVGPAPDSFRVAFETTRGTFVVEVKRAWAPKGADRFHDLVAEHFFDENGFFRVLPEFIAQFGVNNDRKINEAWEAKPLPDDPVLQKNVRGTITFASDGPNSRTHQLFINLKDNGKTLDKDGFAPIGRVVDGMPVVDSIYSGYGETVNYHLVATLGNSYLKRMFPKIDYIKSAKILP
jgi:peptidyl-prolyl cis-trans isomerase A (cyclophilin A)